MIEKINLKHVSRTQDASKDKCFNLTFCKQEVICLPVSYSQAIKLQCFFTLWLVKYLCTESRAVNNINRLKMSRTL